MGFDPGKLKYTNDGVPVLKATEIEAVATEVLQKHCPAVLRAPKPTPVLSIIDSLRDTTELSLTAEDLGKRGQSKILGKISFGKKTLFLDQTLIDGERRVQLAFTAAHEIGHWVLHRWNYMNWRFDTGSPQTQDLDDDETTLCRLDQRTPQDWLEWQANVFAAQLVLPRSTFPMALIAVQVDLGMKRNFGEVWLSDAEYSKRDFQQVASSLACQYGVSKESVRVRLATLGLLREQAKEQARPVGHLLAFGHEDPAQAGEAE